MVYISSGPEAAECLAAADHFLQQQSQAGLLNQNCLEIDGDIDGQ
jgi:hypothetical protein